LEGWARDFRQRGFSIASDGETADLVVVNTCAVTREAVRKSRKLLRRTQRTNPKAKLVVSGCFASLEGDALAGDQGIDLLIPNRNKDRLVDITTRELDLRSMPQTATEADTNPLFARGRQRAFVKVQDGCRYRCTFCIVTLARGPERSRPIGVILADIDRLVAEGVNEVVLTGVHLGGYGSDTGSNLRELIRTVLSETDLPRLRMGSLEPWDLPEGFWDLFEDPRLMPHLHLPLQSGSDPVLRRMARRCRTDAFARLAASARSSVRDFNLTTDIIVGFPGESEAEWQQTLSFVASVGFGQLHIFPYSPRQGTKAAALPQQVPNETKKARSRQMHDLGHRMKRKTMEGFVGRELPMLVEGRYASSRDGDWFGYTPNYLPVRLAAQGRGNLVNQIVEVALRGIHEDGEALVGQAMASVQRRVPRRDGHRRALPTLPEEMACKTGDETKPMGTGRIKPRA
jgi:threonylcarbamoyladenosine tRNA methylthiotransferase MtaB